MRHDYTLYRLSYPQTKVSLMYYYYNGLRPLSVRSSVDIVYLRTQVFIQAFSQSKGYFLYRNANLSRSPLVKPVQSYLFDTLSSPVPSNLLVKWGIILFIPSCNLQGEIMLPRPDGVGALLF